MLQRLLSGAVFAGLLILAAPTAQVLACSCAQMSRQEALSNAEVAFVGVVAAIDDPGIGPVVGSGDPLRYTFAIEEAIKGEPAESLQLFSARSGASCGQEFGLAQRWRVYARADGVAGLTTSLCSGNELLTENAPLPPADPSPPPAGLLLAIGAAVVLVGISALAFMRKPRSVAS
jgi:hypothetical protein